MGLGKNIVSKYGFTNNQDLSITAKFADSLSSSKASEYSLLLKTFIKNFGSLRLVMVI